MIKTHSLLSFVAISLLLTGCGGESPKPSSPAPAPMTPSAHVSDDVMRVGDKITIRLEGVPDGGYVTEMQIPDSGDLSVSYITHPFHVVGRNASDVANEIAAAYKSDRIYTDPIVTIIPEERFINVGGDVRSPTNVSYRPDSTLMSTINSCGGFTEFANRRAVRIIRGAQIIEVDCVKAAATPGADPRVYPGDQIFVPRTMF